MPSSVIVSGLKIYKPGIYGSIDASSLGGKGIAVGNIAVVGEFPMIQHESDGDIIPLTFTSGKAVKDFCDKKELLDIAKFAFSPSVDQRVPGGAASLTLVNVKSNTQAQSDGYAGFYDEDGVQSLVFKSKLWGQEGNKVLVKCATNSSDSNGMDVDIYYGGKHEDFDNLQSGPVAELYYDGSDLDANEVSVDKDTWTWVWEAANTFPAADPNTVVQEPTDIVVSPGTVLQAKLADGGAGVSTEAVTVVVAGLDASGASQTETWTAVAGSTDFGSGAGAYHATTKTWSRIDSITLDTDDILYNGVATVKGTAFSITTADYNSVGEILSFINNNAAKGFNAVAKSPQVNNIPCSPDASLDTGAGGVDKQADVDCQSPAKCTVRASMWYIAEYLQAASDLVEMEQVSTGVKPPRFCGAAPAVEDQVFLFGGTETAADSTSWDNALRSIQASGIQIVVIWNETITYMTKGITHANLAAISGYERQVWVGAPKSQTLATLFSTYTSALNNATVGCCGQELQMADSRGKAVWFSPKWMALIMAAMQAGTPIATPLTSKRPNILDARQDWDANLDVDDAISKGLCVLDEDDLGWKVARSVTTYMEDDNPIYSEVSSWESCLVSVRDLRAKLKIQIGNPVLAGTAPKMKPAVEGILEDQVKEGWIKAFRNVVLEDLGDKFRINYEVAATEPLNFLEIGATVVRISSV